MRLDFVWLCVRHGDGVQASPSAVQSDECCGRSLPKVVYGLPPMPIGDPADRLRARSLGRGEAGLSRRSAYVTGSRAPFARPTYSEGGYAYADSYPYSDDPYGYGSQGYGPLRAYGRYGPYGSSAPAPNYDPPGPGYYQGLYVRPGACRPTRPIATAWRPAPRSSTCCRGINA